MVLFSEKSVVWDFSNYNFLVLKWARWRASGIIADMAGPQQRPRRFCMRVSLLTITLALILAFLAGCSAMMLGGGSGKTYPPADCPEGQTRSEDGCQKQDEE